MSDHNQSSSSDESWHKLALPYSKCDVLASDIDKQEFIGIGRANNVKHVSPGSFFSPRFPIEPFSVQQRRQFFERLSLHEKNDHPRPQLIWPRPDRPRPGKPPQKPKRTFEHDIYLESKMCASAPCSSRGSSCSPDGAIVSSFGENAPGSSKHHTQRKASPIQLRGKPKFFQLSHDYESSPQWRLPIVNHLINQKSSQRRRHSQECIYAEPYVDPLPSPQTSRANSSSLYYASSDVVHNGTLLKIRQNEVVPYAETVCFREKALPKTPAEMRAAAKKAHSSAKNISRKFAFKKALRDQASLNKAEASSDCEELTASLERRVTRARLVRRRTLALYDSQVKAFVSRKAPQLFEAAFLVELQKIETSEDVSPRLAFKPVITFKYPDEASTSLAPPELFFPDFSHNPLIELHEFWRGDEEFVIALTNQLAERKNAYCVKFLPERTEAVSPCVFVIVSPIKSANFYLDLARNAVSYAKISKLSLGCFLKSVFHQSFPQRRGSCLVVIEKDPTGPKKRVEIRNLGTAIGKRGISEVMQRMSPEIVTCVVAALLDDQRVLIAGSTVSSVAQAVQCLAALILPFVWPHTFIPVVPDNLTELAHNPTSYLMGILRSNLAPLRDLILDDANNNDKTQMDFMLVDVDNGLINPRPENIDCSKDREAWRTQNAQNYCKKLGMPKKASEHLMKNFRGAIAGGPGAAADIKIENAMLHWYALLFGHYRACGAHTEWGDQMKAKLLAAQKSPELKPYLAYLCETAMFTEWVEKRQRSTSSPPLGEEVCGSEEALNRKLDEIASSQSSQSTSSSSKPFSSFVSKVSSALSLSTSKKK